MNLLKWKGLDEDPRKITESVIVKPNIRPESKLALSESESDQGIQYLMPRIEAIHAGTTRNYTRYLADKLKGSNELKSGVYSWIHPYAKPVIYNHDVSTRATGRIHNAYYSEITTAGRPGIIVVPKITDKQAIEDILGGNLLTVSIGATTDAAVCSVCGTDILEEGFCGHYKGEVYDGITTEWIAGNLWFDELSWVNVPADQDAKIIDPGQVAIAEMFAIHDAKILDLGKESSKWVVSQQVALAEGLVISKHEKGESALTIEELQAKVTELEESIASLTADLDEAKSQLEAKEAEVAEKAAALEEKEKEVEELTAAKEALEAAKAQLEEELEVIKAEKESLVEKNAELVASAHQALVERVVDLRISLGKESSREEAIERFVKRSTESLNDTLEDLLKEFTSNPFERKTQVVDNPASNSLKGKLEPKSVIEGKEDKQLTTEDALKALFSGPAFNRK